MFVAHYAILYWGE